jgi:type II secretory ATPase GspE/PulE/Tfp pilus assembly ATPase PilB-like protein
MNFGILQDSINRNRKEIISRIKILGKLDIAEKRRPQDGSFRVRVERNGEIVTVDFRVSIVPSYYGENVVLRILDKRNAPTSIHDLGFSQKITDQLQQLLKRTTGILLITGPTGSGKSSTLYAALMTLFRPEIRILTAENPIEYVYDNLSQCEVNEKIGNTFANYLRAFLRHDPEVIMVGEIRDQETAEMAFRAAQTGHMLLSTLHTNDAISAVTRLLDLNIEANMITSSLLGVLAQRLVRKVCDGCREDHTPSEELLKEFFSAPPVDIHWLKGKGCPQCNFTGYKGRMAVAELWTPSEDDIVLINKGVPFDEIKSSAQESTVLMAEDAMEKLRAGKTTLEELMRTLPYSSIEQFCRFTNCLTAI